MAQNWFLHPQNGPILLLHQNGHTPLHVAAHKNDVDMATLFRDHGANIDQSTKVRKGCGALVLLFTFGGVG